MKKHKHLQTSIWCSLVTSTLLHARETWMLAAELERRIQTLEITSYRKLLNISYLDHITNEKLWKQIRDAVGFHDDLPSMVKKRKLGWYNHILRSSGLVQLKVPERTSRRKDGKTTCNGQLKTDQNGEKKTLKLSVVPQRLTGLRDWNKAMQSVEKM